MKRLYQITPVPKPRMTRSDKWRTKGAKRPPVARYHAFQNECIDKGLKLPYGRYGVLFRIPMPKSWSKKKREAMDRTPHQQTPDIDNLIKALQDAVLDDDSIIWEVHAVKIWAETGSIEIEGYD